MSDEAQPQNQLMQTFFEVTRNYCYILSPEGLILDINSSALKALGYAKAELVGQPLLTAIYPQRSRPKAQALFSQGRLVDELLTIVSKSGEERSVLVNADVQKNEAGKITGLILVQHDLTERKRIETQLREKETRYRSLFTEMISAFALHEIICDASGRPIDYRFLDINPAFEQFTGLRRAEVLGKTVLEIMPSTEPYWIETYGNVALTGQSIHFEQYSGELGKYYEVQAFCPQAGQFAVSFTDTTERRQAEEQVRQSSQRFTLAAETVGMGVWEFDLTTQKLLWDKRVYQLYGLTPNKQPLDYKIWKKMVHPEDLPLVQAQIKIAVTEQKEFKARFRIIQPNGDIRHIQAHGVLQYTDTGVPLRMIGVDIDITDSIQLAESNKKLQEQFYQAQKMDAMGQLAGGIAHDFNNLLVPIMGYAEMEMMNIAPQSSHYAHLMQIKESAERAADLTRQILAFSRQQVLEMKVMDLNEIVTSFKNMLQRLIGENILLHPHLETGLRLIKADKGQIEQVLLNLMVNARDAMPQGGTLTLETANVILDESYTLTHPETPPGPYIQLTVSDTGQGMDAATRQRIFEPFFTTKARGQGTGLGLATVFGIIKQHQGSIWVYSEPGQGTTFKVYLPAVQTLFNGELAAMPQASIITGTETILVVEDEKSVREMVYYTLLAYGYNVLKAQNPKEALALAGAQQNPIHLLLTDVIMPGTNGRDLYRQLVQTQANMRVLYMSGYTDNIIVQHGVLQKDATFLQKPFAIRDLLKKVREVLDKAVTHKDTNVFESRRDKDGE
jgi:PAS domain S-box-containing protein